VYISNVNRSFLLPISTTKQYNDTKKRRRRR